MKEVNEAQENGIDLSELLDRVEYDRDLLRELYDIFSEEFPGLHRRLQAAVGEGDLGTVQMTAHTLKGMFASLSFCKASACALRIERMAAQSVLQGMPDEVARMERTATTARQRLAVLCDEVLS